MQLSELFNYDCQHFYDVRVLRKLGPIHTMYLYEYMRTPNIVEVSKLLQLSESEAENIHNALCKMGLIEANPTGNNDWINYDNLYHFLYDDINLEAIQNTLKIKASKRSRDQAIKENLMKHVSVQNEEFRNAFSIWIDARKGAPLDAAQVELHVNAINDFANGDLDKALDVLKIATMSQYGNIAWAIDAYKKQHFSPVVNRQSPQKIVENPKATVYNVNQLGKGF